MVEERNLTKYLSDTERTLSFCGVKNCRLSIWTTTNRRNSFLQRYMNVDINQIQIHTKWTPKTYGIHVIWDTAYLRGLPGLVSECYCKNEIEWTSTFGDCVGVKLLCILLVSFINIDNSSHSILDGFSNRYTQRMYKERVHTYRLRVKRIHSVNYEEHETISVVKPLSCIDISW